MAKNSCLKRRILLFLHFIVVSFQTSSSQSTYSFAPFVDLQSTTPVLQPADSYINFDSLSWHCKNNEKKINEANSLKSKLNEKEITIQMESNEDGKLYGNIGPKVIIEELKKKYNVILVPENIVLGNIRELGNYTVNLRLYDNIAADLKIEVTKKN